MSNYRRELLLSAPPSTVYRALATQQGLRSWWTQACDADSFVGGKAAFCFNGTRKAMRIDSLVPDREVRWHVVEAFIDYARLTRRDEWVGTDIVFRLAPQDDGKKTRLDFEHIGLTPAFECFDVCNAGWNQFLGSLQSLVETGQGQPHAAAEAAALA